MDLGDLTIVVPTKNERENVRAFLDSIPVDVELIVVDDSDDCTPEVIRGLRPENTRVIRRQGNIAVARQVGGEAASTTWLLFTDADVVFAPCYYDALAELPVTERHGAFGGSKSSTGRHRRYYWWFNLWLRVICTIGAPAGSGSDLLVRRRALREAGGFDASQTCNEDSILTWEVKRAGYRVAPAPQLIVHEVDHRRLERGAWRKSLHSIVRCMALYRNLLPKSRRTDDWGYWKPSSPADGRRRRRRTVREEAGGG